MTDKETYYPGDEVKINGTVALDGSPVPDAAVAIEIDKTTSAEPYLIRSMPTGTVSTGSWPLETTDVFLSDEYGNPKSSVKQGDIAYFRAKVRNNEEIAHSVTLMPYFQTGSVPLPIDIIPAFQGGIAKGITYNQTLGKTIVGASPMTIDGDKKFASCFKLEISQSCHANVTKISWRGFSEQPVHAKAIIYSSSTTDGSPLQLLGTSQETILSATTQWWNFSFSPAVILAAGYYWVGIISEDTNILHFSHDPGYVPEINVSAFAYNNDLYSNGPSNPFGTPTYQNRSMSVYATYTLIQDYGIDTIFPRLIPDDAPIGTATIYANAFRESYPDCLPKNGGTVYCPDKSANFTITSKSGLGSLCQVNSQITETLSLDGYYELRLNPSQGGFTLYVSCYYQGETATNGLTFYVKLRADINNDGKVDGKDIAIAAKAFGTRPGDPLWDPRADVNFDNKVDGKDIAIIAKDFGQTA